MSKYGEPWAICYDGQIDGADGRLIVRLPFESYKEFNELKQRDELRRIVACVNACAGMDDPVAEIAALKSTAAKWAALESIAAKCDDSDK
jgi:hypothetical protein